MINNKTTTMFFGVGKFPLRELMVALADYVDVVYSQLNKIGVAE